MAKKKPNKKKVNSISCECESVAGPDDFGEGPFSDESTAALNCRCSNDKDMQIIETKKLSIFDVGDPDG